MTTVRGALRETQETLAAARIRAPQAEARLLLAHALGDTPGHLPTRLASPLEPGVETELGRMVARRIAGEPLAYITGETEFMGLRFKCDARALVPRPDTEIMVEVVLEKIAAAPGLSARDPLLIVDLGTGTGCIAVSLAHRLPRARVIATDISCEALELAAENAALNGVQERVQLLCGAYLEPLVSAELAAEIRVLVSNPPYVSDSQFSLVEPEVSRHEPGVAIHGGVSGLDFYEQMLPQILATLPACERVVLEFGFAQEEAVAALVTTHLPGWRIELRRDLSGIERVLCAARPPAQ